MALDLGTKTIGVAVSDVTGLIARGVETIRRQGNVKDFARLDEIIRQEEVNDCRDRLS
jgi:putative Holliday junction resolvase